MGSVPNKYRISITIPYIDPLRHSYRGTGTKRSRFGPHGIFPPISPNQVVLGKGIESRIQDPDTVEIFWGKFNESDSGVTCASLGNSDLGYV